MSKAPTATGRLSAIIAGWPPAMQAAYWMLIIGSLVTFTLVFARQISADIHVFEIVFFRSVFGLLFMAPWMLKRGISSLRVTQPGIIGLRGALAFFGSASFFYAATLMPLADVTSIIFIRPIVATIAAIIFLHEVVRLRRWAAIVFGMIGALIIVRPGFAELNIGVLFALVTVCSLTWNTINLKIITRTNSSDALAIWHMAVMLPLGAVACLFIWTTPTWEQLGWMALIGIFEMLGQRAMSRGYKAADTTVLMAFTFLRLPIAAFLGFALFGEVPEIWVWLGAAVIAASSIYIAHRESIAGKSRS
ncbi:MAG: drug/metabolite transporter (DMT)-like permease [Alphaproteobacteria bacterium]|jgi:drug/metabolite transporter (DMT)-like permease